MRVNSLEIRLDELLSYWQLLDASVRIDKPVSAPLQGERDSIHAATLAIAKGLSRGERAVETLVDVRLLLAERILATTAQLVDDVEFVRDLPWMDKSLRGIVFEVQEMSRSLFASVDLMTLECTPNVRARRTLVSQLHQADGASFIDAGAKLCRLTCAAATERLERGRSCVSKPESRSQAFGERVLN
ncbi:MAG: hypothetical protein ABW136_02210 [Steroidobacteraceae bacterium]